jgi:hypothetical protein
MKRRNRSWGCKRIAQQIALAFGIEMDKDVVRRILGIYFRPEAGSGGPSWLSFIGHAKDSLWSLDLFRCESALLRTYWVLVVMDQFTRRIVGFTVHRGVVDGMTLCRMFNRAIRGQTGPKYLSTDNDPLYRFPQWQANLPSAGGDGNQDGALCAFIPSVCGAAHRDRTPRMPGPHVVLDRDRPGEKATRFPTLL